MVYPAYESMTDSDKKITVNPTVKFGSGGGDYFVNDNDTGGVSLQDLYTQDPGVVQSSGEGTIANAPDPIQITNAQAGQAQATQAIPASIGDVSLASLKEASQGPGAVAAQAEASGAGPASVNNVATANAQQAASATGAEAYSSLPTIGEAVEKAKAGQAESQGYDAQTRDVTANETASGRLLELSGQDAPLQQRAKMTGLLTALRRGLPNSSIAAGAAQAALTDRLTPVAQSDAQAYQQQALNNQNSVNRAREFTADAANTASGLNAQLETQVNLAGLDATTRGALQDAGLSTEVSEFNTDQQNQLNKLNAELGTRTSEFNASQRNTIAQLNAQLEQDASQFTAAEANRIKSLNAQMQTETAQFNEAQRNQLEALNAELGTQTEQLNVAQRNTIAQLNAQMKQDASLFNSDQQNRIAELNAQMTTEINARNAAAANEGAFLDAQLRSQINDANASRQLALQQGNTEEANRHTEFILSMNNDINKQFLAGSQSMDLAQIQGRFNQLISANESASRFYEAYFNSIAQAMGNDKITPGRISTYIRLQQDMLEAGLSMIDEMNSLELSDENLEIPPPYNYESTEGQNTGSRSNDTRNMTLGQLIANGGEGG